MDRLTTTAYPPYSLMLSLLSYILTCRVGKYHYDWLILVEYIDNNYRTLSQEESRGICGHSMGGAGSLTLAMKHPDIYCSVFSFSGGYVAFEHSIMNTSIKEYLIDAATETDASSFNSFNWRKQTMVASAAAIAPDTNRSPFYGQFPVDENGALIDTIWAKWLQHDLYKIFGNYELP